MSCYPYFVNSICKTFINKPTRASILLRKCLKYRFFLLQTLSKVLFLLHKDKAVGVYFIPSLRILSADSLRWCIFRFLVKGISIKTMLFAVSLSSVKSIFRCAPFDCFHCIYKRTIFVCYAIYVISTKRWRIRPQRW